MFHMRMRTEVMTSRPITRENTKNERSGTAYEREATRARKSKIYATVGDERKLRNRYYDDDAVESLEEGEGFLPRMTRSVSEGWAV